LFSLSWDKSYNSLESESEFGINLASLANMRSLIHRNLYRGLVYAIWAEVLSWFTADGPLKYRATCRQLRAANHCVSGANAWGAACSVGYPWPVVTG
jgi:hypothetical protein